MWVGAAAYRENPWCKFCLQERLDKASAELGPVRLEMRDDGYSHFVPAKP